MTRTCLLNACLLVSLLTLAVLLPYAAALELDEKPDVMKRQTGRDTEDLMKRQTDRDTRDVEVSWRRLGKKFYELRQPGRNKENSSRLCVESGGTLPEPRNRGEYSALRTFRGNFYLGINDHEEEGNYVFESDGARVTWFAWFPDSQIGEDDQDCVLLLDGEFREGWVDIECSNATTKASTVVCEKKAKIPECQPPSRLCADKSWCIRHEDWCDGVRRCDDGSDEVDCENHKCHHEHTKCDDKTMCIPNSSVCDGGGHDCKDKSDEVGCDTYQCLPKYQKCADGRQCVHKTLFCNGGFGSCTDKSDERDCVPATPTLTSSVAWPKDGDFIKLICNSSDSRVNRFAFYKDSHELPRPSWMKWSLNRNDHNITRANMTSDSGSYHCVAYINDYASKASQLLNITKDLVCRAQQRMCADHSRCLSYFYWCDGKADCKDGSDEQGCESHKCYADLQRCANQNKCVRRNKICDGHINCDDGSDEGGCEERKCFPGQQKCHDERQCVYKTALCDGHYDCSDYSDEQGCEYLKCKDPRFNCKDLSKCLYKTQRCDGFANCRDKSDEQGCESHKCSENYEKCANQIQCVSYLYRCNGIDNCRDGSDELGCENYTCIPNKKKCANSSFCLYWKSDWCDGHEHCDDGSDERGCALTLTSSPATPTDGDVITLTCNTTDHRVDRYKFYKGSHQLAQRQRNTYKIKSASLASGSGSYHCVAYVYDKAHRTSQTLNISVQPKTPTLTSDVSGHLAHGSSITFTCTTASSGSFTYTLLKANWRKISRNREITVNNLNSSMTGDYICVASYEGVESLPSNAVAITFVDPTTIVNPTVPFVHKIPGGMSPGKVIYIVGVPSPSAEIFGIDLWCGPTCSPVDIPLHISVRFTKFQFKTMHINSKRQDNWELQQWLASFPFKPEVEFEIKIVCEPSSFKIYVDNKYVGKFFHRINMKKATHIRVQGDTSLTQVRFEKQPLPTDYNNEEPVFQPAIFEQGFPFERKIPGGMTIGRVIYLEVKRIYRPRTLNGIRVVIELYCGPGCSPVDSPALIDLDVELPLKRVHYSQVNTILFNSRKRGILGEEERIINNDEIFDYAIYKIKIVCELTSFKIYVQSNHFATFLHRIDPAKATYIKAGPYGNGWDYGHLIKAGFE